MPSRLPALPVRLRLSALALCLAGAAQILLISGAAAETPRPRPRPGPEALRPVEDSPAGAYLAARQASAQNDFAAAVPLYARALALDPGNHALLDGAIAARLATGDVAGASQAARVLLADRVQSQAAVLAVVAADAEAGDFAAIKSDLSGGNTIGQMTDALILAWAELGQGSMSDAMAAFDKLAADRAMRGFASFHKALAMALSGDFEGADKLLSGPEIGQSGQTRRALVARVEVMAQLDRRAEALALLDQAFPPGSDGAMEALRARLKGGDPVAFDVVTSPRDGVTEVLYDMATALSGQADDGYALLFARTAVALRPSHVEAAMLSAQLLQRMDQQDLAAQVYALIPRDNPAFLDAEIGRANAALAAGRGDEAVTILQGLAAQHPQDAGVVQSLADTLRRLGRFDEAVTQYDRAIAMRPLPKPDDWPLYYARAISLSEQGRWPEAEADFRKALDLNPNQPQVLNYLGYSYVDRGENLDEALKMIQRAVMAAPDQGYIVDSLAWAYFRLGRYQDAVVPMERASLLEPVDPIVTDHLGDVYWMVGRRMEAQFQWRRALSFDPRPADAERIRRKLELGLDKVLEEEKAGVLPAPAAPVPEDATVRDGAPADAAPVEAAPVTNGNGG